MEIIKIGLLVVLGIVFALQFKTSRPEYSTLIGVVMGLCIFGYGVSKLGVMLEQFQSLQKYLGNSHSYLKVLFQAIGVTYVCEFSAGVCKDAGFGAVGEQIELLGKVSVLIVGSPIFFAIIEQIETLI